MNGKSDKMSSTRTSGKKKIVLSILVVSMFLLASFAALMPTASASNEGKTVDTLIVTPNGVTSHEGWDEDDYEYAIDSVNNKCTLTLKGGVYDCGGRDGIYVDGEWGEKVLDIVLKGDVTINCSQPMTPEVHACICVKHNTTVNINGDATLTLNYPVIHGLCYSITRGIIHIGSDGSTPRVITQALMIIDGLYIDHGVVVSDLDNGSRAIICYEGGIALGSADSALCISSEGGPPFFSTGGIIDLSKGFLYLESKTGAPCEIPSKTGEVKKISTDGINWDDYSSGNAKYFKSSPATAEFYFGSARGGSASFAIDYKDCETILVGQPVKIQAFPHTDEDEFSAWTDGSTENPRWVVAEEMNLYTPVFRDDSGNHVWVCFHVGGDLYQMQYVKKNTPVSEPMEPTAEGKEFLGWYTVDDVKWDFTQSVGSNDLDLYAKFEGQEIVDATETGEAEIHVGTKTTSITVIFADKANLYIEDVTKLRGKTISVSLQSIEDHPGMYDLDVEDTTTNEDVEVPMKVTLPYDDDKSGPVVYYYPDDGSDKVDMNATVNHDWTVTFTTTHNSVYSVEYPVSPSPSSDNSATLTVFAVIFALILVALVVIAIKPE